MYCLPCRYNVLFQFLMRLKRVQLKLEAAWQSLHALHTHAGRSEQAQQEQHRGLGAGAAGAAGVAGSGRLRQLYLIRHHMSHLIANLQIYIQVGAERVVEGGRGKEGE